VKTRVVQTVRHLDNHGYGPRMTTWWGTLAFIAVEGMGLALAAGAYLYIAWLNPDWPLSAEPPDLLWGTALTLLMIVSAVPNAIILKTASQENKRKVQVLLVIMSLIGVLCCVLRAFEFTTLNIWWDTNAYGSLLWFVLGLHTTHLVTDVAETIVLTVLMFTKHGKGKRFSDVEDNAVFWYFVIAAWGLLYLLLYWFPRVWGQ
jgi:cytochrome c oxidase subunit 3